MPAINEHLDLLDHLPSPAERREIRVRLGISQRLVAEEVGVTSQAVAAWEAGQTPGGRHLAAYVDLLDRLRRRGEVTR